MPDPIDPRVDIGHVHLKVADIDRALAFYQGILGFEITTRMGQHAVFLSAGGYHHHLGFNTLKSRGGGPQPDGVAGLHHVAINVPTRAALGDVLVRLREADWPLRQKTDHGTHLAVYISDPDGNDLELAWDRPFDEWPRDEQGHVSMAMDDDLDVDALIAEATAP